MNTIYTRSTRLQAFCWFFILLFTNQLFFPAVAVALTAGPSQPEVKSFEPVGTTEMVNLFSGDFTYNIPLLEVPGPDGGYPINLFYNSVTSMEQEATWTGLGWNINVGALSRSMRGLPDDFNGEKISRKLDVRENVTTTAGVLVSGEVAGINFGSLGLNYVYNSYKGAGFSIAPTVNLISLSYGQYSANLSAGLSVSTLDLAQANVGFSISAGQTSFGGNLSFDATGNERFALGLSRDISGGKGISANLSMNYAKPVYTPAVAIPWTGSSISIDGTFDPGGYTVHGQFGASGSYDRQFIMNKGIWQQRESFGYNYLQNAVKENLLDFNREKDGLLEPHKRYLANPVLTHDVYSVTGQGIGGSFRSYRSDYGFLHDPYLYSTTTGDAISVEGGVAIKVGANITNNIKTEEQNPWPSLGNVTYTGETISESYEPFYYNFSGEMTAEKVENYNHIGGEASRNKPVRLRKDGFSVDRTNGGGLEAEQSIATTNWNNQGSYHSVLNWNNTKHYRSQRKPRSTSIQPITNKLLKSYTGNNEMLPEYDVKYYNTNSLNNYSLSPSSNFDEITRSYDDQNAGFTVVGKDGVRWNYSLPVYNKTQKNASFSVTPENTCVKETIMYMENNDRNSIDYIPSNDNLRSDDRIDEQHIPQFTHSHLLTSVLGTDYGDIDGIPGPSDGDVGYWMKTNYVKLSDDYQWRAPFFGANYAPGFENDNADDMGALTWGEREVYLPATVETKTHIAFFEVSRRYDARGAKYYIQNSNESDTYGEYSYKLDKITLYAKSDIKLNGKSNATPLKTVHFQYDYSLCKGIDNYDYDSAIHGENGNLWAASGSSAELGGKLTLKSVYFTYENNNRGALSPYEFEYSATNPNYDNSKIDKWGMYASQNYVNSSAECDYIKLPYTSQGSADKARLYQDASAWHIEKIHTPSGATIQVQLERDDYAYVQDARATRLFKIRSTSSGDNITSDINLTPNPQPYQRTLQFELEQPTSSTEELQDYVRDLPEVERDNQRYKQLYAKIRVNLRNSFNETYEYVPAYCEIAKKVNGEDDIAFDNDSYDANTGKYTRANIVLNQSRIDVQYQKHHPLAVASWKFLKDNLPQKMLEEDLGGAPEAVFKLSQIGENIIAIFSGYYKYCAQQNFAQIIDLDRSFIRLNTPDRVQYGGGVRVKSITMDDNWTPTANQTSTMGVVYDYTTEGEDGNLYSSGVVENEPAIGQDECALTWAVPQEEYKSGQVIDIDWYKYPLNEGYHPGASVGYSQVTVRSLAADYALKKFKNDPSDPVPTDLANSSYATTGQTVYNYYTAKDFPIITNKTSLDHDYTNPWVFQLSLSFYSERYDQYTGTQGYSIELNDMHGREHKVATYQQKPDGSMDEQALTKVEYIYKSENRVDFRRGKPNQQVRVLSNEVDVLVEDNPTLESAETEKQLLGVNYELFMDGREALQTSTSTGVQINAHVIFVPWPLPIPIPIPSHAYYENKSRTSVSNKVIVRSGILEEVYAFDGQAHLVTTNKVFDPKTGQPLLSTVDNQLTGEIYNYSVPAYLAHEGMGAAAENWGHRLDFTFSTTPDNLTGYFPTGLSNEELENVVPGDEFIAELKDGSSNVVAKARAVYMGELYVQGGSKQPQFDIINHSTLGLPQGALTAVCTNTRSGKRNLIGASIAQYSTIDTDGTTGGANPLTNRTTIPATTAAAVEISVSGGVASLSPTTATSVAQVTLDNVLSTSGAEFSEDWALEYYNYNVNTNNINPYLSGKKGVWKSKSTYAYIDARTQEPLTAQPKLADIRSSGVLNGVTLYNWQDPFVQYVEGSKWVRTQDISKYRLGGQAVESRDVLGNYQAALYGYGDNLVTAQAANAKYYEVGYEGFEEWNQGDQTLGYLETKGYINNGNIDVLPGKSNTYREQHEHYRLIYPMYKPSNGKSYVLIKKPYVAHALNIEKASVYLSNGSTKERIEATIENIYPLDAGTGAYKAGGLTNLIDTDTEGEYTVLELNFSNAYNKAALTGTDWWAGELTLFYQRPVSEQAAIKNTVQVVQDYAHTGEYSLLFPADEPNLGYVLEQKLLNLQDGKKYVFSAWVKMQQTPYPAAHPATMTYANSGASIEVNGVAMGPTGPVIEGWQKVEGTFTYDNGWVSPNTDNTFEIKVKPSINYLYLDDIRIFPADGNIVSYVYDPVDFKLRATLDDNNYATFYVYDEAGNLISTKRETERGIKSIQEARNYIQPTN